MLSLLSPQRTVGLLLTLVCVLNSSICAQNSSGTISVSGEAEVSVLPNIALIKTSIESMGADVPAARKANSEATKSILEFLKKQQVEQHNIHRGFIEIRLLEESNEVRYEKGKGGQQRAQANQLPPQSSDPFGSDGRSSSNEQSVTTTYQATRELTISVTDLEKLEEIYCGLLTQGINRSPIVELQSTGEKEHLKGVRQAAVQDAKDKAELMAGQLRSQLASIRSITESKGSSGRGAIRTYDPFDGGYASSTSLAGRITYSAQVEVVFQLSDEVRRK